ncbi:MAG: hypothetical protein ABI895_16555 [Deltaproteobacteria bacterium]
MSPALRKLGLTAHITASVGWFGAVAGFLALATAGLTSQELQTVRAAYLAMDLTTRFVIVPASFAALLTGVVQSLGTPWGLFRYYWVLVKLVITVIATAILLLHTRPIAYMAAVASEAALSAGEWDTSISVHRVTASATYDWRKSSEANWATTLIFGEDIDSPGRATPSFLLETNWDLEGHHVLFGRAEYLRKTGEDLVLPAELEDSVHDLGLVGLGYVYYLGPFAGFAPGLGVRGSAGLIGPALEPFYETRVPLGVMVFAQLRPATMSM